MNALKVPIPFGRYLLLEPIATGGMAEIFKAKTFGVEGFERLVAVKRILPSLAEEDEFIDMFVDEARIAVQLSHPNVVPVYELGRVRRQYFIAMEYVAGCDLRYILDILRDRGERLPLSAVACISGQVCDGLDYAHEKTDPAGRPLNIIHRDVSPRNVLVSYDGIVKLTDFGIAKAENRITEKTKDGVLKGRYGYLSPEQVSGLEIDHRSDIFAVGILIYEALTGTRLFVGDGDLATLERVRHAEVAPPREIDSTIPEAFERIVLKALTADREDRYPSAAALQADLQRFLIVDQQIYDAKRLGVFMRATFPEELGAENASLAAYLPLEPPPGMTPLARSDSDAYDDDDDDDETPVDLRPVIGMVDDTDGGGPVFERDLSRKVGLPTFPGETATGAIRARSAAHHGLDAPVTEPVLVAESRARGRGHAQSKAKRVVAIATSAASLSFMLLVLVLVATDDGEKGDLSITSEPVTDVELLLDGQVIGTSTPLGRDDIAVGEHILIARADGYRSRMYRFESVAGEPVVISIELNPYDESRGPQPPGRTASKLPGETSTGITGDTIVRAEAAAGQESDEEEPAVAWARATIRSVPPYATVYYLGEEWGMTPVVIEDLDPEESHTVGVFMPGYGMTFEKFSFSPGEVDKTVEVRPRARPNVASGASGCGGYDGIFSVMTIGARDCRVRVNGDLIGTTPFFKKPTSSGSCQVDVACSGGKRHRAELDIKPGATTKLIINDTMWSQAE